MDIYDYLNLIDEPNRSSCLRMLEDNKDRILKAPGSRVKHQAFEGGYIVHLEQAMRLAQMLCDYFREVYSVRISDSDAILVLWLHDWEKPFKYIEPSRQFENDEEKKVFMMDAVAQYGIQLSEEHLNALKYVHGEGDDYHPLRNIAGPLAALCHICDTASARILNQVVFS